MFQGAHVTINARTEDDIDEETVKSLVAKSSGSNYSIHKEKAQPMPEAGPVVSTIAKDKYYYMGKDGNQLLFLHPLKQKITLTSNKNKITV